jgi:hypothetical protein
VEAELLDQAVAVQYCPLAQAVSFEKTGSVTVERTPQIPWYLSDDACRVVLFDRERLGQSMVGEAIQVGGKPGVESERRAGYAPACCQSCCRKSSCFQEISAIQVKCLVATDGRILNKSVIK